MENLINTLRAIEIPKEVISVYLGIGEIEIHLKSFDAVKQMPGSFVLMHQEYEHVKAPHPVAPSVVFSACRKLSPAEAPQEGGAV